MKTFTAVIVLIGVVLCVNADLSDEQKQKLQAEGKECIEETKVDVELVKKARQGTFSDDQTLKAFTGCMSRKIGFQDASGEPQIEVIREKLGNALGDKAVVDQLIEKCVHKKGTPDETAFEIYKCYYESTPTHLTVF